MGRSIYRAEDAFLITPNDNQDLPQPTRAIAFVTAGALHIITARGNEVTLPSGVLAAGLLHSISIIKIFATGTTASGIVGFS